MTCTNARITLFISLVALFGAGCHTPSDGTPLADYKADRLPYAKGLLVVAGSQLPVTLKEIRRPGEVVFNLDSRHGETFEHEAYQFDSDRFALWRAGGEMYDPVIPLLKNPVVIGSKWAWNGRMVLAVDGVPLTGPGASTPASADVAIARDKLNLRAGPVESTRVDVILRMSSGSDTPAERKLSFWFVAGQGMVKREFAASSTRIPDEGP